MSARNPYVIRERDSLEVVVFALLPTHFNLDFDASVLLLGSTLIIYAELNNITVLIPGRSRGVSD